MILLLPTLVLMGALAGWRLVDLGTFFSPDLIGYFVGITLGYIGGAAVYVILVTYLQEPEQ